MASTATMTVLDPSVHQNSPSFRIASTSASTSHNSYLQSHLHQPHLASISTPVHTEGDLKFRIPSSSHPSSPLFPDGSRLPLQQQNNSTSNTSTTNTNTTAGPAHVSYQGHSRSSSGAQVSPAVLNSSPSHAPSSRDKDTMISLERPDQSALASTHSIHASHQPSPIQNASAVPTQQHPHSTSASHSTPNSAAPRTRAEQHATSRSRETKFGDYVLGRTLGEGEFGKVKMGWKREGSVQVAIKLVRRESIKGNSKQLPKISREIAILRKLRHSHIVRLVEIVETERHIGIILEYASGGELFDHILKNRYLKDSSARRLFAQLISGVGYLHNNGIVHRDLKLENLLLDRNNNIIITDFGFANTFNPTDELTLENQSRLGDREYVKENGLDLVALTGFRPGDLMQTSCGSPCYAAPELVVTDSLYTGRKVDVWSCGVILYAMLAGYLPFDDDPENPEGDNIHKLYQYIISTPLTFPEWVTPHARDLLKRMLVPKPTERADLFEVARHSWLSPYATLLSTITATSGLTNGAAAAANAALNHSLAAEDSDGPGLTRSASVREPFKKNVPAAQPVGGLTSKHGNVDPNDLAEHRKTPKDAKRRTVQVEYVPPHHPVTTSAQRQTSASKAPERQTSVRERTGSSYSSRPTSPSNRSNIPVRRQPVSTSATPSRTNSTATRTYRSPSTGNNDGTRPSTRGSTNMLINGQSKGQPAPLKATSETASGYISAPHSRTANIVLCSTPTSRTNSQRRPGGLDAREKPPSAFMSAARGHKRSSTIGGAIDQPAPPPSARASLFGSKDNAGRPSSESRRMSFAFSRRNSSAAASKVPETPVAPGSSNGLPKSRGSHRLSSFLSSTTSLVRTLTGGGHREAPAQSTAVSRAPTPDGSVRYGPRPTSGSVGSRYDGPHRSSIPVPKSQYASHRNSVVSNYGARPTITKVVEDPLDNAYLNPTFDEQTQFVSDLPPQSADGYAHSFQHTDDGATAVTPTYGQAPNGRFPAPPKEGSARRVMDFFRKRGSKRDSSISTRE